MPVSRSAESEEALVAAARLAAERGATIAVVRVLEVPLELPLDADLPVEADEADALLDEARALVESYGVRAIPRLAAGATSRPGDRRGGAAARTRSSSSSARRRTTRRGRPVVSETVDTILKASPSRVLVVAGRRAA